MMRVLIAGLGEHKEFGLRSLRDEGHFVGVLEEPYRVPVDSCDWWAAADYLDAGSLVAAARQAGQPWDVVLCWEEVAVDVAHEAARRLGLPHPRMPAGNMRDKGLMHDRVRAAGLASPQLGVATSLSRARELARDSFPVVVKPADFGGSCGVSVARGDAGLATAYQAAAELSVTGRIVIDRHVDGPEYSVEAVTWSPGDTSVLCVIEKTVSAPPYCVELGHRAPARLTAELSRDLAAHSARVLDALGMAAGVSHGEYKLTPAGPVLMEVAGRPAGGQIPRLVQLVTGHNLYLAELAAAAAGPRRTRGQAVRADGATAECGAVVFFTGDGRSPAYRPVTAAEAGRPPLRDVLREVRYWVPPEMALRAPRDVDDRAGFALVAGTAADVDAALLALGSRH